MKLIARWIALLVGLALCGYAIFVFEYHKIADRYRDLLQANSTYVELERHVRDAAASHQFALFAAANSAALPAEEVKGAAAAFVEAARDAAKASPISAFDFHFGPILSGANMVEDAVAKPDIDLGKLREGLNASAEMMNLLVLIAGEGRAAELRNLKEGRQSELLPLLVIIGAYAFFVVVIAYFVVANIRRTVAAAASARSGADGRQRHDAAPSAAAEFRAFGRVWSGNQVVVAAAVAVVLGFAVVANRDLLQRGVSDAVAAFGAAEPVAGVDAAYDAFRKGDPAAALRLSQPLAEQGDARAQTLMGLLHYLGRGATRDFAEARRWFVRAAEQGEPEAPFRLAGMYFDGRGVPQDFEQAAKWYRTAADRNNPHAQYNLGILYLNGRGVPKNKVMAHMWFNLAAANFPASDAGNRDAATRNRDMVGRDMSHEEILEAQKLAREWKPK